MNINEIVLFPAQLTETKTTKISAEAKENIGNKFGIKVETNGRIVDEFIGETHITVRVESEGEGFYLEEEKVGIFKFDEKIEDEKKVILFLEVQGVRILWSYIREDLYTISSKMLPNPIMIPTIDVMKTLEKAE